MSGRVGSNNQPISRLKNCEIYGRVLFFCFCLKITFRVEGPHVTGAVCVEGPDLDLVIEHRARVLLEEEVVDGHVQGGDDLLRVADQLTVEVPVELLDVAGVDVQVGAAKGVDLIQKGEKEH